MLATKLRRSALFLAALGAAGVFAHLPGKATADEPAAKRLSEAEFDKLHAKLKPQPGESRWMEVEWYPTLREARDKAADEGKPLFLWAGSGGAPAAGC